MRTPSERFGSVLKLMLAAVCLMAAAVLIYPQLNPATAGPGPGSAATSSAANDPAVNWVARPAIDQLGERPLVAFTGIQSREKVYEAQLAATKWSDPLADLITTDPQARWVERQSLQDAIAEVSLTRQLSQDADVLKIGRWSRADLVVHAWVDRTPEGPVWEIKVIDTVTAEIVAHQAWRPDQPEGLLGIDQDLDGLLGAFRMTLAQGIHAAQERRQTTRLAGLFIRNVSPSGRLSQFEPALFTALEQHAGQDPDLHLMRFDQTQQARGERALAMMGLTDNQDQAWLSVADYYLWGSIQHPVVNGQRDTDRWELEVEIWDGGEQPHALSATGSVQTFATDIPQVVDQVIACLPAAPSAKVNAKTPSLLSRRLIEQAGRLRSQLLLVSAGEQIPTTDWGWRVHAGRTKLYELACFFDPTHVEAWSGLLGTQEELVFGDQEQEYQHILGYMNTRHAALSIAGSKAMAREQGKVIAQLLRKLSGGWGLRGLPQGMESEHFRPLAQSLIDDLINTPEVSEHKAADLLLAVIKSRTTDARRLEATRTLWPVIRPGWERQQRQTRGRESKNPRDIMRSELEAKITQILVKQRREDLLETLFTLDERPERNRRPKAAESQRKPFVAEEVRGYDLRWTPDPDASLTNRGRVRGLTNSETLHEPHAATAGPYLEKLGLTGVSVDAISKPISIGRPNDHRRKKQRVPMLAAGDGFSVLVDVQNPAEARLHQGESLHSLPVGGALAKDNAKPLAHAVLAGLERDAYPLGEAFSAGTVPTDLTVARGMIWVATNTEGVFSFDTHTGDTQQYLFEHGLLDRHISNVLANDRCVVLGYREHPTFAYKLDGEQAFRNVQVTLPARTQAIQPHALSGHHVLVSDVRNDRLYVVDVETGRMDALADVLSEVLTQRWPTPRGYAADGTHFYVLFDQQVVRVDAVSLACTAWDVPRLEWTGMWLNRQTLWMTAHGPGSEDYSDIPSLLVWGWDLAREQGSQIAYGRGVTDGVMSMTHNHLWSGRARFARGYDLGELRAVMGLPDVEPVATPPTPRAIEHHKPGWLSLDMTSPKAVREALDTGVLDTNHHAALRRLVQHAIIHDRPEVLIPVVDRVGTDPIVDATESRSFMIQAAQAGATDVIDLMLERSEDDFIRRFRAVRALRGFVLSGNTRQLQHYLPQALPFSWREDRVRDIPLGRKLHQSRDTTPIEAAAFRGEAKAVALLLPHVEDDRVKANALVLAVLGQHHRIVKTLLRGGADPANLKFYDLFSAAQLALALDDAESLRLCLKGSREAVIASLSEAGFVRGLVANQQFASLGRLIGLGVAIDQRHEALLKGSDGEAGLTFERTSLGVGRLRSDDPEGVWQDLIDAGVAFDHAQGGVRVGGVMLIEAAASQPRLAMTLLDAGYGPDVADAYGTTPLMAASFKGNDAMVEHLLDRGAAPDRANLAGQTAASLLADSAPQGLASRMAAHASARGTGSRQSPTRTVAEGAAGRSPMLAARRLRQLIADGDLEGVGSLLGVAMVDFDDGVGAGTSVLEVALDEQQPQIAAIIADKDWSLTDYWTGRHRFNDALELGYFDVAQIIVRRAGWSIASRKKVFAWALSKAQKRQDARAMEWLQK